MIRECVTTHGVVRPLEPERDLPALHIDPSHLGLSPALGADPPRRHTATREEIRWNHATNRTTPRARDRPITFPGLDHREEYGWRRRRVERRVGT